MKTFRYIYLLCWLVGSMALASPMFFGTSSVQSFPTVLTVTSGLLVHYTGDGVGSSDGDAVGTWADTSGNSNNALQASGPAKPVYKTAVANGHAAVRFNGSASYMTTGNFSQGTSSSVVVAFSQRGAVSPYSRLFEIGANSNLAVALDHSGPGVAAQFGSASSYTIFTPTTNVPVVVSVVMGTGSTCAAYLNGITAFSGQANDGPTGGSQALTLGNYGGGTGYFWNGDILEYVEYDHVLTSVDRKAIESYFGHKYSITITP